MFKLKFFVLVIVNLFLCVIRNKNMSVLFWITIYRWIFSHLFDKFILADKKLHSTEKTGKIYQKNRGTNNRGKMTSEMLCRIENSSSYNYTWYHQTCVPNKPTCTKINLWPYRSILSCSNYILYTLELWIHAGI